MSAVKAAKGAGLYTMVSSVATPRFMQTEDYRNIYQLAVKLKVNEYRIVEAMPCGKLLDNDETVISAETSKRCGLFTGRSTAALREPKYARLIR